MVLRTGDIYQPLLVGVILFTLLWFSISVCHSSAYSFIIWTLLVCVPNIRTRKLYTEYWSKIHSNTVDIYEATILLIVTVGWPTSRKWPRTWSHEIHKLWKSCAYQTQAGLTFTWPGHYEHCWKTSRHRQFLLGQLLKMAHVGPAEPNAWPGCPLANTIPLREACDLATWYPDGQQRIKLCTH